MKKERLWSGFWLDDKNKRRFADSIGRKFKFEQLDDYHKVHAHHPALTILVDHPGHRGFRGFRASQAV